MTGRSALARGLVAAALPLVVAGCSDGGLEVVLAIDPPASTDVVVGDVLALTVVATSGSPTISWATSDERVAQVADGSVEARRPGTVTITASAPGAVDADIELTVVARAGGYTADEVDYFTEIAFGAEFGASSPYLRRWPTGAGPRIRVNGSPTPGDLVVLDSVIAEIDRLTPAGATIVTGAPSVELHFVPQSEFQNVLPQAPPGNNGLVWLWWDGGDHLTQAVVLVSTTTGDLLRAHIIREEVTQMLGLLQDSYLYPQSIFYQGVSTVTEYLPIDRAVIELLYRPELHVGMTAPEAAQVARTLTRVGPSPGADPAPRRAAAPPGWWGDRAARPGRGVPGSAGGGAGSG